MSKRIRTKETIKGTIKQLDRAAIVSDRMRRAYIQTKEKAEHSMSAAESNPEEYASDRITSGSENIIHETGHQTKNLGQKGLRHAREQVSKARDKRRDEAHSPEPQPEQPRQQAQRDRIKTREVETPPHRPEPGEPQHQSGGSKQTERGSRIKTRDMATSHGMESPRQEQQGQAQSPRSRSAGGQVEGRKLAKPPSAEENVSPVEQGRKRVIRNTQRQRVESSSRLRSGERNLSHVTDPARHKVKTTARSTGRKTVKTAEKTAVKGTKAAKKSIKTAERTAKTAIKTSKEVAKTVEKSAQAAAKAAQKAAQVAKATAKAVAAGVKAAAKATVAAVKAIIAATKSLVAAIAAGGWVAVLVIVIIMLIALLACSVFGIFFSGEDSGTGLSMPAVVQEINADYDARLEAEKASVSYDVLEMSGSRAVWKEVLAVYAVKVNTDPDSPSEIATMDATKKQLLTDIFWEMNEISSHSETESETVIVETDDGEGNIVETESVETTTTLYITVCHKSVDEMSLEYGFNQEQKDYLAELLADENNSLWTAVLYGIGYSDDQIVTVALSQIGNAGGVPYWSWYGFGSHVEWCACFVSWCANECGYIDDGIIPKYSGCVNGVQWFKDRAQWVDGTAEPVPGMIIFFDWDNRGESGPQDGLSDHTGIVEKVKSGRVYTVEGNSGDSVKNNSYTIGHYEILGYGVPAY